MSRRANDTLPPMLFAGVLVLLAVWAMDDLRAWTRTWFSAPAATTRSCPLPSDLEQLHIVVRRHGSEVLTECLYVGARGSYTRRSVRIAESSR
jgi:hypothetical protein